MTSKMTSNKDNLKLCTKFRVCNPSFKSPLKAYRVLRSSFDEDEEQALSSRSLQWVEPIGR